MAFPIKVPKNQTPEWRRAVATEIVKAFGRDLTPERLCDVSEMDAWNWCFAAFGKGVPVVMATMCEVVGVSRAVGSALTWGRDLAYDVERPEADLLY